MNEIHEILPGPAFQGREYRITNNMDPRNPDRVTYARLALNARLCWIAGRILGGIRGPYNSPRTRSGTDRAIAKLKGWNSYRAYYGATWKWGRGPSGI